MPGSDLDVGPSCSGRMELREEDLAHSLSNVSEDRSLVRATEPFGNPEGRNALLERDMDSLDDDPPSMGVRRRSVSQALDPDLWSTLPLELLHLVFAHLPLVDIVRLRVLSTTWDRYVSGDMPGFTKVCAEVNPTLSGMISTGSDDYDDGLMAVMLPGSGTSWFRYLRTSPMEPARYTIHVGDGGLVCTVLFSSSAGLHPCMVVRNPLTCRERALPRLPQPIQLWMVQLVMDRDLKCYKVLVLAYGGAIQAHVFCSVAGKWRSPEASDGPVFGYRHRWVPLSSNPDEAILMSRDPCVYDSASGELVDLDDEDSPWNATDVLPYAVRSSLKNKPQSFALVKDRLFVLHEAVLPRQGSCNRYLISEYQARRQRPYWVKLRDHNCGPCEVAPLHEYSRHLYACRDFLLVTAISGLMVVLEYDLAWVYEIASEKWREIDDVELEDEEVLEQKAAMIELQWDAVP